MISTSGFLLSCRKDPRPEISLPAKSLKFRAYTDAIDNCKKLPLDSLLKCARNIYDIDTVKNINKEVWYLYGRAKGLLHNRYELEAIEAINQGLLEAENNNLPFEKAEFLELRGFIYSGNYKIPQAAEDMYKAAELYLRLGLKKQAAKCYLDLENLQFNSENYKLAIDNGRYAIDLIKKNLPLDLADSTRLMYAYNTMGLAWYRLNDYDKTLEYFDSSYFLAVQIKDEFWQRLVKGNTGLMYFRQGKTAKAIDLIAEDVVASLKYKDLISASKSLLILGEINTAAENFKEAKVYYDSAYHLMNREKTPQTKEQYYKNISEWYKLQGDFRNSLNYYERYITLRDSLREILTKSNLEKIQNEKTFEKQLADINLLKAKNELREKELGFSRILIAAAVLIVLLLLGLLFAIRKNYKNLRRLNTKLEEKVKERTLKLKKLNYELDTYLYRASHDVRRPILTIIGLSHVADLTQSNEERFKIHRSITKTAYEMDNMLKKLQMAYELEKDRGVFSLNISSHLGSMIETFVKEYPSVTFDLVEDKSQSVETDVRLFDIALNNILENACIFSSGENQVTVVVNSAGRYVDIRVKDKGIGIEQSYMDTIFDAYTRYSNLSKGSGLGLYLARKAIKKINGSISVSSKVSYGSEFLIRIPVHY